MLLEYNRFADLIDIIDEFALLYDDEKKIAAGTATTAVKLDDDNPGWDGDYSEVENGVLNESTELNHVVFTSTTPEISALVISPDRQ